MQRKIAIITHTGRASSLEAAKNICHQIYNSKLTPIMLRKEHAQLEKTYPKQLPPITIFSKNSPLNSAEIALTIGGDGTILRSAEIFRNTSVPLLGINLGHVGFLAETEAENLPETITQVIQKNYRIEQRFTLDVQVKHHNKTIAQSWALNEASVEKSDRATLLEIMLEIDQHPLSSYGCDGIVLATPTGSTAYAFSAGGPIVWPQVEAILAVPRSAHALFATPLVVAPQSTLTVKILARTNRHAILWCDGRRTIKLPPGSEVEITKSNTAVRLVHLYEQPFSNRLVKKFNLPSNGWRKTKQGL